MTPDLLARAEDIIQQAITPAFQARYANQALYVLLDLLAEVKRLREQEQDFMQNYNIPQNGAQKLPNIENNTTEYVVMSKDGRKSSFTVPSSAPKNEKRESDLAMIKSLESENQFSPPKYDFARAVSENAKFMDAMRNKIVDGLDLAHAEVLRVLSDRIDPPTVALSEEQRQAICVAIQFMDRDISDLDIQAHPSAIHAKQELETRRDALRNLLAGASPAWVVTEKDKSIMQAAIACFEEPCWTKNRNKFEYWEPVWKLIELLKKMLKEDKS